MPGCARCSSSLPSASASRPWRKASSSTHESHKLQALGCDVGQGYLYAKPMSKAQLIGAMRRRLVGGAPLPVPMPKRRLAGLIAGLGGG